MMYLYAMHNVVMVINVNELCGRHNVPRPPASGDLQAFPFRRRS